MSVPLCHWTARADWSDPFSAAVGERDERHGNCYIDIKDALKSSCNVVMTYFRIQHSCHNLCQFEN